ncbi:MAG: sugar ABC transporter ATP-binding protein [Anaerolineae bacterium]|nr:sugar ABC transporter ATP-binding protein [Anaerolineae bacterium]
MNFPEQTPLELSIYQANKAYNGIPALIDAQITLRGGEVHGLIGENGAGKSTLIKLLAGVLSPDSMRVTFNEQPVELKTPQDAYQLGLRFIHQELNIVPSLSVAENIFLSHPYPRIGGVFVNWRKLNQMAQDVLHQLGVYHINVRQNAAQLSSGDAMLMKIASAFIGDDFANLRQTGGLLYIMDEPTASLTNVEADILFDVIDTLRQQGCAVLYVTHRLNELFKIAQQITVMRDGEVVGSHQMTDVTADDLIREMTGREMENVYPPRAVEAKGAIRLEVQNFSTAHVHDINFTLREGEIVGIAGLNGSGRSELLQGLMGADARESGTIYLEGQRLPRLSPTLAWEYGIAYVPEERRSQGLILTQSIAHNITLPHLAETTHGMGLLNHSREHLISQETSHDVQLRAVNTHQRVKQLSGGNQQKVVFARTMVKQARVLLLDEPTRGIDVGAKFDIYSLMRQFSAQGVSILMVSSELDELINMCDRILIMRQHSFVDEVVPTGLNEETLLSLCYGNAGE